jgi:hypothetical protein
MIMACVRGKKAKREREEKRREREKGVGRSHPTVISLMLVPT